LELIKEPGWKDYYITEKETLSLTEGQRSQKKKVVER